MRLFVAIELPEPVRLTLAGLCDELQARWSQVVPRSSGHRLKPSWVRPEKLHLTLKFLGEVAEPQVPKLCAELARVRIAEAPIRLRPDRVECLPPSGPVRVICVGVSGDLERLADLHRQIEERCEAMGFPRERRRYRPHVTLARLKEPLPSQARRNFADAALRHLPAPAFNVAELVLMQSQPHSRGSRYIPLARLALDPR